MGPFLAAYRQLAQGKRLRGPGVNARGSWKEGPAKLSWQGAGMPIILRDTYLLAGLFVALGGRA